MLIRFLALFFFMWQAEITHAMVTADNNTEAICQVAQATAALQTLHTKLITLAESLQLVQQHLALLHHLVKELLANDKSPQQTNLQTLQLPTTAEQLPTTVEVEQLQATPSLEQLKKLATFLGSHLLDGARKYSLCKLTESFIPTVLWPNLTIWSSFSTSPWLNIPTILLADTLTLLWPGVPKFLWTVTPNLLWQPYCNIVCSKQESTLAETLLSKNTKSLLSLFFLVIIFQEHIASNKDKRKFSYTSLIPNFLTFLATINLSYISGFYMNHYVPDKIIPLLGAFFCYQMYVEWQKTKPSVPTGVTALPTNA